MKESELRIKMEEAIDAMQAIILDKEEEASKKTNAANALSGLVTRYKETFGLEPDSVERPDAKKVTGYKG